MTLIESIVHGLRGMPTSKQVEVARYVHRLNENATSERAQVFRETHGYLSDEEAVVFEQGVEASRQKLVVFES